MRRVVAKKWLFLSPVVHVHQPNANVGKFDRKNRASKTNKVCVVYSIIDLFAAISGLTLTALSLRNDKIYDGKLKDREREGKKIQTKIVCLGVLYAVDGFGKIDSTTVAAQINRAQASKLPTD